MYIKASACQNVICWKYEEKFTFLQTLFVFPNWLLYLMFILLLLRKKCFKKFRLSWDMTLRRGISGFPLSEGKLGNIYPKTQWPTPKDRNLRSHPCESLKICKYFNFSTYGNGNIQRYAILFNPLNAELNPICHLLALLGAHPVLHVSKIKVNVEQ